MVARSRRRVRDPHDGCVLVTGQPNGIDHVVTIEAGPDPVDVVEDSLTSIGNATPPGRRRT
jgi:hypothetical protein